MGGPIRSKRTGIVVVMPGFTVHVLESKMDYLNDQESKFLSSVKAREIRRTQRLPFVISGGLQWFTFADHGAYNYKEGICDAG